MIRLENLLIASFGLITVIVFYLMLTVGGLFDSLHSLLYQEISYLISPFSPQSDLTIKLFIVYNIYLIFFSIVLFFRFSNWFLKMGSIYLILSSGFGFVILNNPMDPVHLGKSIEGITHISVALSMFLYLSVALYLMAMGFHHSRNLFWLSKPTFIVVALIILFGFIIGLFALFSLRNYVGLAEKLPMTAFLVWLAITAVAMLKSDKRIKYFHRNL